MPLYLDPNGLQKPLGFDGDKNHEERTCKRLDE